MMLMTKWLFSKDIKELRECLEPYVCDDLITLIIHFMTEELIIYQARLDVSNID